MKRKLVFVFVMISFLALGVIADGANPDNSGTNSKFKSGDRAWTTTDVKVRSEPGLSSAQINSLADGNSMIKGNMGTIGEGPISKDGYNWWKISYDIGITGWSAENYLELVSDGPKQPDNFVKWSDDAIIWATDKDRIGAKSWNGECMRFVSNAFRQKDVTGESGYASATDAARALYRFNQEQGGWQHAPRGAIVFFNGKGNNPAGHVGIYLGDGKNIINAYGKVGTIAIEDAMAKGDVGKYIGWSYPTEAWRPEATGEIKSPQPTEKIQAPVLEQQTEASTSNNHDNHEGHQKLIAAITDLENVTLDSIDYSAHQTADSYALLATAADLTTWWGELARLSLDTINSVVGLAMAPQEFLTPDGAKKALKDPSTFKQIISGIKDSKNTLGAISAIDALRGIFRDAESYKLSFEAISKTEDAARQEYKVSKDNTRAANAAWLELWTPSTTNGLLIPLRTDAKSGEGNHESAIWVNGVKAAREKIKESFDDFIQQVPDPLPADYPLNQTLTYLKKLTNELRRVDNRVVSFDVVNNGEIKKRPVTLGIVQSDRETTGQLYNAWMNKLDVQYDSTLYNTGETICSITTYTLNDPKHIAELPKVPMKILNGGSEALGYVDAIHFFEEFPSELAEEITKPVDPLDALQGHSVAMTDDLVTETSNLWTISNETLKYLQYTWKSAPTVQAFNVTPINLTLGKSFSINYTVSDIGGAGLKQIELWRTQEKDKWPEKPENPIQTKALAGENGPTSGSFTDSPSAPGKYWYGLHVVDNAGNWNDEKNSNTNNQPSGFEPVEVVVKSSEEKIQDSSGEEIRMLEGHSGNVRCVAFSPDGRILASGSNDKTVKLWDVSTGNEIRMLEGHSGNVRCVAFSPDGHILASSSDDGKVKLWDVSTGKEIRMLESRTVNSIAFSSDGRTLASCGSSISPCSSGLADCISSDTTLLWDVSTGNEIRRLYGHSSSPRSVAFSPDGQILAEGGDFSFFGGFIQLWDVSTGNEIRTVESDPRLVFSIAFSPDGSMLASGGFNSCIKLCDVSTGTEIRTLDDGNLGWVRSVAFSPDGRILASSSDDSRVKLWDVSTGTKIQALNGSQKGSSIAFSPDGSMLASGDAYDGIIRLWRVA